MKTLPATLRLDVVSSPYEVDSSQGPRVDSPIVDNEPPFSLTPMFCKLLCREGWRAPRAVSPDALASVDFLLELVVHPLGVSSFQVVRGKPTRVPYRDRVVFEVKDRSPGSPRDPIRSSLPSSMFDDRLQLLLGEVFVLLTYRVQPQSCDNRVTVLLCPARVF